MMSRHAKRPNRLSNRLVPCPAIMTINSIGISGSLKKNSQDRSRTVSISYFADYCNTFFLIFEKIKNSTIYFPHNNGDILWGIGSGIVGSALCELMTTTVAADFQI